MSGPRVRFCPLPRVFFHVGSARTALFNWLCARQTPVASSSCASRIPTPSVTARSGSGYLLRHGLARSRPRTKTLCQSDNFLAQTAPPRNSGAAATSIAATARPRPNRARKAPGSSRRDMTASVAIAGWTRSGDDRASISHTARGRHDRARHYPWRGRVR